MYPNSGPQTAETVLGKEGIHKPEFPLYSPTWGGADVGTVSAVGQGESCNILREYTSVKADAELLGGWRSPQELVFQWPLGKGKVDQ